LNEINEMKSAPITKPNDEIKFWKSKGAKLTKAFKLTQDERVKVLIVTLQKAINLGKRNSKTLDDFQKQLDELQREYTKTKEDENLVATLERHFNAIDSSVNRKGQSLSNFIEPISNLITHTKLIWMNTKHFHKDTARFKLLMDAVEREINSYIRKVIKVKLSKVDENNFTLTDLMTELTFGKLAAETFEIQ